MFVYNNERTVKSLVIVVSCLVIPFFLWALLALDPLSPYTEGMRKYSYAWGVNLTSHVHCMKAVPGSTVNMRSERRSRH